MGNVQPAAGRTGDASRLRLLLMLLLLLLIHGGGVRERQESEQSRSIGRSIDARRVRNGLFDRMRLLRAAVDGSWMAVSRTGKFW